MIVGGGVIVVLVVGLGLWASLSPLSTGVTAQGEVRVESNRKTIRHPTVGVVRQVLVREGQHVREGQPLLLYNDVESRAATDVSQNQVDSLEAQAARYAAEATGKTSLTYSPDLLARASDPRVAGLIRDQEVLFQTRLQLFESQNSVLNQRIEQIQSQIAGQQDQIKSLEEQERLTKDEMSGYQTLYDKGFAPKPLILRYERSVADLEGRRGALMSEVARLKQQQGETRMQIAANRDSRTSQAAEGLRDAQARIADAAPRLSAAKESLAQTVVRSPVDGYVFTLTQFTPGGVTTPGEPLMEIVPANAPLIVSAQIEPQDVNKVHVGMDAKVRISALNSRWHKPLNAKVIMVSADRISSEKSEKSFFRADLRVEPAELTKLEKTTRITPGMSASVQIVNGQTTIMGSLISPITDTLRGALADR
ncbi:MAG: HlyD family type I secretion periplasmic adaptor subunit [Proteobacteria bacterium]|nr:HlyD family type I secretion periplasmic adaptor subunit [Pseudomonadota bacterium]